MVAIISGSWSVCICWRIRLVRRVLWSLSICVASICSLEFQMFPWRMAVRLGALAFSLNAQKRCCCFLKVVFIFSYSTSSARSMNPSLLFNTSFACLSSLTFSGSKDDCPRGGWGSSSSDTLALKSPSVVAKPFAFVLYLWC